MPKGIENRICMAKSFQLQISQQVLDCVQKLVVFPACDFPACDFPDCDFPDCDFPDCDFPDCDFLDCDL